MKHLLSLAVDAHGGLDRWRQFDKVKVHMQVSGILWTLKRQNGVIDDSRLEIDLHKQRGRYIDFDNKPGQGTYFSPVRVAIIDKGDLIEELLKPRDSFNGHEPATPWSKLQLVYFSTYAIWAYLTSPFLITLPGFYSKEIKPWLEGNEIWRRLQVTFPDGYAYHSKKQVFYFNQQGLLKRIDFAMEIVDGANASHYMFDYKEFQGITLPTKTVVYWQKDGYLIKEPLVIQNLLLGVEFS